MDKILSIIIPTYNMEKYLRRCLDSLLVEENFEMLEVWVVNDGSKDGSFAIAHEYSDKYPSVFNVIDKPNGNYGSCINAALPRCTGKYVKVLDSDDYFNTEELQKLIERLIVIDSDVILLDYTNHSPVKSEKISYKYNDGAIIDIHKQSPEYFGMHSIAYKTEIFHRFDYKQTEGVSYTDQEWIFYPMFYAQTLQYISLDIYQYVIGREGQTMVWDTVYKRISQITNLVTKMLAYLDERKGTIPASVKRYAENVLDVQIKLIYRAELIHNDRKDYHKDDLIALDNQILRYDIDFYRRIEQAKYKKIKYVKIFHGGGYWKMPLLLRRLIVAIPSI